MKNLYLTVGIIVVILFVVAFAVVRNKLPQISQLAKPSPTPAAQVLKETISASKHTPAKTAVVDKVSLTKPGFVVIHENQNGQPGEILGVSELLQPGTYENIAIELSRKTIDGELLFATVHVDNDDGKFDPSADGPAKDESGNVVQTQFQVLTETGSGSQIPSTGLGEDSY